MTQNLFFWRRNLDDSKIVQIYPEPEFSRFFISNVLHEVKRPLVIKTNRLFLREIWIRQIGSKKRLEWPRFAQMQLLSEIGWSDLCNFSHEIESPLGMKSYRTTFREKYWIKTYGSFSNWQWHNVLEQMDKVCKNGPSKICGRQPLKKFTWSILE